MTTVGYGDFTPQVRGNPKHLQFRCVCMLTLARAHAVLVYDSQTVFGRLTAVVAMLWGIMYLAMPIAIVGNNFYKSYEKHMKAKRTDEYDSHWGAPHHCVASHPPLLLPPLPLPTPAS